MQEAGLHAVVRGLLRKATGTLLPFIHTPLLIQGRAASDRANLPSNAALIFSKTKVKKQNKTVFENRSLLVGEVARPKSPGSAQVPPARMATVISLQEVLTEDFNRRDRILINLPMLFLQDILSP
ncbi:unnamed protein product [Gulo gulo]|uniref:Uncharacterized protein n=1 Tax=Gulo gulo TaxID=48420 RepID=A0A9X9M3F5_GULGU|nr:unnamed protein product [Gulo gulo]